MRQQHQAAKPIPMCAYADMINMTTQSPHAIHLTTNCHLSSGKNWSQKYKTSYYSHKLYLWDSMVMRSLLGRYYNSHELRGKRQSGFLTYEHAASNFHYHGLLDLHDLSLNDYIEAANKNWKKLVPAGDVVVIKAYNTIGASNYILKDKNSCKMEKLDSFYILPKPAIIRDLN